MNGLCMVPQKTVEAFLFGSFASSIISPLTAVLTCRFLLNLHQADRCATRTEAWGSTAPSQSASLGLHFAAGTVSDACSPTGTGGRSRGTAALPPFIASMGKQVSIGPHSADPIDSMDGNGYEDEYGYEFEDPVPRADDSRSEGGDCEDTVPAA